MAEFALVIPVFLLFIYGLIVLFMWGTAGVITQEAAHEVARKYAVSMDAEDAKNLGSLYIGKFAYIFVDPGCTVTKVEKQGEKSVATITVVPRIQKLFVIELKEIERQSNCVFEHIWRERSQYE